MTSRSNLLTIVAVAAGLLISMPAQSGTTSDAIDDQKGPADATNVMATLQAACDNDNGNACTALAVKGCDSGCAESCKFAASRFRFAQDSRTDLRRAAELFIKGCNLGDGAQCAAAADLQDVQTSSKALALFRKGCDLGNRPACEDAATYLYMEATELVDSGLARLAYQYATRVCTQNDAAAEPYCKQVADSLIDGFGVAANETKGEQMLKDLCQSHPDGGACSDLGQRYLNGDGVYPSTVDARAVVASGCDAGDSSSCSLLALL